MSEEKKHNAARVRINALGAVLIAAVIASFAAWLLMRPIQEPVHLTPIEPRPELLDKPHRQWAAPATSAQPLGH